MKNVKREKVRVEQKIVMVYTLLGLVSSFITNYLYTLGLNLMIVIALSLSIYFITLPLLLILTKNKKMIIFYNSFVTFILVWLTFWILLYNLGGVNEKDFH
ncbi:MAG: hypothetical protein QXR09_01630 [Candidatus Aenigmatarchaeota archaeon]